MKVDRFWKLYTRGQFLLSLMFCRMDFFCNACFIQSDYLPIHLPAYLLPLTTAVLLNSNIFLSALFLNTDIFSSCTSFKIRCYISQPQKEIYLNCFFLSGHRRHLNEGLACWSHIVLEAMCIEQRCGNIHLSLVYDINIIYVVF